MPEFRWRPLEVWPRKNTTSRRALGGEQSYDAILSRLDYELQCLRARDIVIQTGHRSEDMRQDNRPRSSARQPAHPGVIVSFDARTSYGGKPVGPLSYACDSYRDWKDNLRGIVLTLEALRAVDRYGATSSGEQYRGWAALPAPGAANDFTAKRDAALVLLKAARMACETEEPITEMLKGGSFRDSVIREALKKSHPDTGGSGEAFRAVQQAREVLGHAERA